MQKIIFLDDLIETDSFSAKIKLSKTWCITHCVGDVDVDIHCIANRRSMNTFFFHLSTDDVISTNPNVKHERIHLKWRHTNAK